MFRQQGLPVIMSTTISRVHPLPALPSADQCPVRSRRTVRRSFTRPDHLALREPGLTRICAGSGQGGSLSWGRSQPFASHRPRGRRLTWACVILPGDALIGFDIPAHDGGRIDADTVLRVTLSLLGADFAQLVMTDQVAGGL